MLLHCRFARMLNRWRKPLHSKFLSSFFEDLDYTCFSSMVSRDYIDFSLSLSVFLLYELLGWDSYQVDDTSTIEHFTNSCIYSITCVHYIKCVITVCTILVQLIQYTNVCLHEFYNYFVKELMPELHAHFRSIQLEPHMYAAQWFLTFYTSRFPLPLAFRVMDLLLLDVCILSLNILSILVQYIIHFSSLILVYLFLGSWDSLSSWTRTA